MVRYPKGQVPRSSIHTNPVNRSINYGSRGMSLEERINESNRFYLQRNIAVIHKKPTPIQVVKVDYPKRSAARISEAYYRQASTTDYNGIYQGFYIDFEAKETKNKRSFPLSNLKDHQINHMKACFEQGGLVFLMICFTNQQEVFLLPYQDLANWLDHSPKASISYDYIKENAYLCKQGVFPQIDYLLAVDQYLADQPSSPK